MDFDEGCRYALGAVFERKLYADYLALAALMLILSAPASSAGISDFYALPAANWLMLLLLLFLGSLFASLFFYFKFLHFGLSGEKLSKEKYSLELFLRCLLAVVVSMLHTVSFWRVKKWALLYILPLAGMLLFLFSPAAAAQPAPLNWMPQFSIVLSVFGIFALLAAYIYQYVRLSFMLPITMCMPKVDMGECSRLSWGCTRRKSLTLFAGWLIFHIAAIAFIAALCITFAGALYLVSLLLFPLLHSDHVMAFASLAMLFMLLLRLVVSSLYSGATAFFYTYLFKTMRTCSKKKK